MFCLDEFSISLGAFNDKQTAIYLASKLTKRVTVIGTENSFRVQRSILSRLSHSPHACQNLPLLNGLTRMALLL